MSRPSRRRWARKCVDDFATALVVLVGLNPDNYASSHLDGESDWMATGTKRFAN